MKDFTVLHHHKNRVAIAHFNPFFHCPILPYQSHDFFQAPNVVADFRVHRWCHAQGLVNVYDVQDRALFDRALKLLRGADLKRKKKKSNPVAAEVTRL